MFEVTKYSIAIPLDKNQQKILEKFKYDCWESNCLEKEKKLDEFYNTMRELGAEGIDTYHKEYFCFDCETLEQAENVSKKLLEFYLK